MEDEGKDALMEVALGSSVGAENKASTGRVKLKRFNRIWYNVADQNYSSIHDATIPKVNENYKL